MKTKKSLIIVCIFVISIVGGLVAQAIFGDDLDSDSYNHDEKEEQQYHDSEEYTDENEEYMDESDATTVDQEFEEIDLKDLFFDIDDTMDTDDVDTEATNAGLYINEYSVSPMYKVEISGDDSPEAGDGAEEWYKYDEDHIGLTFFENDDGEMELSSKEYYMVKNHVVVEYSFYDEEIKASNYFPGYDEKGPYVEKTDFKNLKEAMRWAKKYKTDK